ncbi:MAG: hypothetical protein ACK4ST_14760 [Elioraea tepidiphila]
MPEAAAGQHRLGLARGGGKNCSLVEMRLLHLFAMRDGRIARETVYEGWRRIG